ncbi:MAG: hypothetical protein AB1806_00780 [Acidobacteriota bacterium]
MRRRVRPVVMRTVPGSQQEEVMQGMLVAPVAALRRQLDLRNRLIATLLLLALAGVLLFVSSPLAWLDVARDLSCGLIVLAAAGVWVSYFAERQALISLNDRIASLTAGVDARFSVLKAAVDAGIEEIYYDPENTRGATRYRLDLLRELEKPRGTIRILAIAAREFLFRDEGFAAAALDSVLNPHGKRHDNTVRTLVALLHPQSEQAVSRALREHPDRDLASFDDTNLWQDIKKSCVTVCDWQKNGYSLEARLYKVMPSCFLVFVNDVVFVEFYQFGSGGRASGKVPLLRVARTSPLYDELLGHWEYVWGTASHFPLNQALFDSIKNPDDACHQRFLDAVGFCRPDLRQQVNLAGEPRTCPTHGDVMMSTTPHNTALHPTAAGES